MKKVERDKAIKLRKQGFSMGEIKEKLGVSKSSVSLWVRDVILTQKQRTQLTKKGYSIEIIEKRRYARMSREKKIRDSFLLEASNEIRNLNKNDLFMVGISLYWGEGSKTKRGSVEFSNSDARLIKIMKVFFEKVCFIPKDKFRGHVYLHPHLDTNKAERYWSKISGIPRKQFHKTTKQHNRASKNKKDSLPYGTFTIAVYDTKLFLKIMGWMDGIYKNIIN